MESKSISRPLYTTDRWFFDSELELGNLSVLEEDRKNPRPHLSGRSLERLMTSRNVLVIMAIALWTSISIIRLSRDRSRSEPSTTRTTEPIDRLEGIPISDVLRPEVRGARTTQYDTEANQRRTKGPSNRKAYAKRRRHRGMD